MGLATSTRTNARVHRAATVLPAWIRPRTPVCLFTHINVSASKDLPMVCATTLSQVNTHRCARCLKAAFRTWCTTGELTADHCTTAAFILRLPGANAFLPATVTLMSTSAGAIRVPIKQLAWSPTSMHRSHTVLIGAFVHKATLTAFVTTL